MIYLIKKAPNITAGIENGTNHKKIFHLICFLKTKILDAELVSVPTVKENGTTDVGSNKFNAGIRIKLAPPPQIALSQNAKIVVKNKNESLNNTR